MIIKREGKVKIKSRSSLNISTLVEDIVKLIIRQKCMQLGVEV